MRRSTMAGDAQTNDEPEESASSPVYELKEVAVDLTGVLGTRRILSDISLTVHQREIVGIVGRSGTGKTTLMRALGGLTAPAAGELLLNGEPISGNPEGVVTIFQDYGNALLPWRTVAKNVALPLEGRMRRSEIRERVDRAIDSVQLRGRENDYLNSLSGGMQQRVQIARALAVNPAVLLMDEPFGALDALTKASLQDVLLDLHSHNDATIIFITHDLDEAIYLSDRTFVISGDVSAGDPGHLSLELDVELPRPRHQVRTRESPDYLFLRHTLGDAIDLARG